MNKIKKFYSEHKEAITVGYIATFVLAIVGTIAVEAYKSTADLNGLIDGIVEEGALQVRHKTDGSLWLFEATPIEELAE